MADSEAHHVNGNGNGYKNGGSDHHCEVCNELAFSAKNAAASEGGFRLVTCNACQSLLESQIGKCDQLLLAQPSAEEKEHKPCDLSAGRSICSICRLNKVKQLLSVKSDEFDEYAPAKLNGNSSNQQKMDAAIDEVKLLQKKVAIRRYLRQIGDETIPLTPSNFEIQSQQAVLQQIMNANRDYISAKYFYTTQYFMSHGGIPGDEDELWHTIGLSVEDIVKGNIPFARQLAGSVVDAPADMCRLIDAAYWLMYCVQSGVIAKNDVVSAFGMFFRDMLKKWPELGSMMEHARQVVQAVRIWNPRPPEFAFLMSLIFCKAIRNDGMVTPSTMSSLEKLAQSVSQTGAAYVNEMYGEIEGRLRWKQLEIILEAVLREQDARLAALRPFKERTPELVRTIVRPVCGVVCKEFSSVWAKTSVSPRDDEMTNYILALL